MTIALLQDRPELEVPACSRGRVVRHLCCGTGKPLGARLFPRSFGTSIVTHCLLFEGDDRRLVLVDAGFSEAELRDPSQLGPLARFLGVRRRPELAAARQIRALGRRPEDVTDIILTHLDLDHVGGVQDFPAARLHVHERELDAAKRRRTLGERMRYRSSQWEGRAWIAAATDAVDRIDDSTLGSQSPLLRVGGWELSYVPLFGHTRGHCGVLARSESEGRVLHCGDAYYGRRELWERGSLAYRAFRRTVDVVPREAARTRTKLVEFIREEGSSRWFCSHDAAEFSTYDTAGTL